MSQPDRQDPHASIGHVPRSESSPSAATTPEIAWFGGYRGAIAIETRLLHLIQDDGTTFCREPGILASATSRNIGSVNWCDVCVRECQKVRRDA